jgi:hypothetical protein
MHIPEDAAKASQGQVSYPLTLDLKTDWNL